jgi:hypothetical protein
LTTDLFQVIVQSKEPSDKFLFHPLEKDSFTLLADPEDTVPCMDKVMIGKGNITKELTGVQGVM